MNAPQTSSFVENLLILRSVILRSFLFVFGVFILLAFFARELYQFLSAPLIAALPEGASMIATDVASPFLAPFKLAFVLAFFLSMPFILHQIWRFIAPGLYQHEKRLVAPLLISSSLLFYAGVAFAYFILLPIAFAFFTLMAPEGIAIATDISSYLGFVLKLFFAFGVAFEIPIAVILMCWAGLVTPAQLQNKRPFVIVGAFVVGMLLTPPDVVSQVLLAIPMWLLFELGVLVSKGYVKPSKDTTFEQQE